MTQLDFRGTLQGLGVPLRFAVAVACMIAFGLPVDVRASEGDARPVAVSPGDAANPLLAAGCPTFSWGGGPDAESFELAVFAVDDGVVGSRPVLRQRVPGVASSWTPSLDRCLGSGTYAWSVRAVTGPEGRAEWSEPLLFRVWDTPPPSELRESPSRLERRLGQAPDPAAGDREPTDQEAGDASEAPKTAPRPDREPAGGSFRRAGRTFRPSAAGATDAPLVRALTDPPPPGSLNLSGNLVLGGDIYRAAPQLRQIHLSANDFQPFGDDYWVTRNQYSLYVKSGAPFTELAAPVHGIPPGALIAGLECRVVDNSSTERVSCDLEATRYDLSDNLWGVGTSSSDLSPDPQTSTYLGVNYTVLGTERLFVEFYPSDASCDSDCKLYWVTITYLVNTLD